MKVEGFGFRFRDLARVNRFVGKTDDSDVDFYVRRNPGYEDAEWLAIWVPWNLRNLATSGWRVLRSSLAGALRRDRAHVGPVRAELNPVRHGC